MLTQETINSINESVLCWLATANENGAPNVSPKEMYFADGTERILIANIASPNSVRNIDANPSVCVSFINIFKQKGFKVKGLARIIQPNHADYSKKEALLRTLGGEQFKIKSIIEVQVKDISPIVAPSYHLFPDTTESSQIQDAMDTYGVQARNTK